MNTVPNNNNPVRVAGSLGISAAAYQGPAAIPLDVVRIAPEITEAGPAPITLHSLAKESCWVAWRLEKRGDNRTKVPYVAVGKKAEADAAPWLTRADAEALYEKMPNPLLLGGLGIEFCDLDDGRSVGGIDLDACRNAATGHLEDWAGDLIDAFDSYAEVSPSGTGVKIYFLFTTADWPKLRKAMGPGSKFGRQFKRGGGRHPPAIELHLGNRYFAVTDDVVYGMPLEFRHVPTEQIIKLITETGPAFTGKAKAKTTTKPASKSKSDVEEGEASPDLQARIAAACAGKPWFAKRWNGDWTGISDTSRSGLAFTLLAVLKRDGFTFGDGVAGLRLNPHTSEWMAEKGEAGGLREPRRMWDAIEVTAKPQGSKQAEPDDDDLITEASVADSFRDLAKDHLRYDHTAGRWFVWNETHWQREETRRAFHWASQRARAMAKEDGDFKTKVQAGKASFAGGVERHAQSDPAFTVTHEVWDRNPWLLGTPGGVVDLRTGILQPAQREDMITKLTAVTPAAPGTPCPIWMTFLQEATRGDADLIRFMQQIAGYCLTGDTQEHALFFVYGPGGNGKGVFLNTTSKIIGHYAVTAGMDTFTASQSDRHPTDLAMLKGARMVCASETEDGKPWAEARIKQMTGGDPISARFMRQDFFTFDPEFKLLIIGNHQPTLRNVDDAARRRFNIIPFVHKPEKKDMTLGDRLKAEWPAILRWMIDGCLDWQAHGLVRPAVVTGATAAYFEEQDSMQHWIDECCVTGGRNVSDTTENLFKSWTSYALTNGEKAGTTRWFNQAMARLGAEWIKDTPNHRGKRGFLRIAVKTVDTSGQWMNRHEAAE